MTLWVIIPAYQEEARIDGALRALAAQHDRDFTLLVADNGSTDATVATVRAFAAHAPFPVHVLTEPQKGVGCAVDTAFHHAIAHGATLLARTDADPPARSLTPDPALSLWLNDVDALSLWLNEFEALSL